MPTIDAAQQSSYLQADVHGVSVFGIDGDSRDPCRGRQVQGELRPGMPAIRTPIETCGTGANEHQRRFMRTDIEAPHFDGLVNGTDRLPTESPVLTPIAAMVGAGEQQAGMLGMSRQGAHVAVRRQPIIDRLPMFATVATALNPVPDSAGKQDV